MRTDVWAFGCVLYEMLTGRPAFAGRSVSEVVAAVLRDDPDWDALPAVAAAKCRSAASPLSASRSADPPSARRRRAPRPGGGGRAGRRPVARQALRRSTQRADRDRDCGIAALWCASCCGARLERSRSNRPARLSLELPAPTGPGRRVLSALRHRPERVSRSCSKPSRAGTQQLYVRESDRSGGARPRRHRRRTPAVLLRRRRVDRLLRRAASSRKCRSAAVPCCWLPISAAIRAVRRVGTRRHHRLRADRKRRGSRASPEAAANRRR